MKDRTRAILETWEDVKKVSGREMRSATMIRGENAILLFLLCVNKKMVEIRKNKKGVCIGKEK